MLLERWFGDLVSSSLFIALANVEFFDKYFESR